MLTTRHSAAQSAQPAKTSRFILRARARRVTSRVDNREKTITSIACEMEPSYTAFACHLARKHALPGPSSSHRQQALARAYISDLIMLIRPSTPRLHRLFGQGCSSLFWCALCWKRAEGTWQVVHAGNSSIPAGKTYGETKQCAKTKNNLI
jgi:hypothetical protein